MRLTKLALLGLCALLLGLMAFGTSAAQAEPGNAWVILDKDGTKLLVKKPLLPVLGAEVESGTQVLLLAKVLNGTIKLEIHCSAAQLIEVHLLEEGQLSHGKAKFTGCVMLINGAPAPECEVHSAGSPVGTVETEKIKGLLSLHELKPSGQKDLVILIEPLEGTTFVTFLMGEECVVGEEMPIEGKLVLKDCELKATEHLITHLIESEPALTKLTVLDDPNASIDGSLLVFLTGEHKGLKWAGEMP